MAERLPAGRHHLTHEEVAADQRRRIFKALAAVMSEKGYGGTSVGDIIKHARVSRPTFYEFFDSKQDCFMAGYARLQQRVIDTVLAVPTRGTPMERFESLLGTYLVALASDTATSRLYLVEVNAAGPEAMRRRLSMQQHFVDGVVTIFKSRSRVDRFACQALVAAISTLVTHALIDGGADEVLALHGPLVAFAQRTMVRPVDTSAPVKARVPKKPPRSSSAAARVQSQR